MGLTGKGLRHQTRERGLSGDERNWQAWGHCAEGRLRFHGPGTALFSWGVRAPPVGSSVTGLALCNLHQTPPTPS